jgi:hypothetical protein
MTVNHRVASSSLAWGANYTRGLRETVTPSLFSKGALSGAITLLNAGRPPCHQLPQFSNGLGGPTSPTPRASLQQPRSAPDRPKPPDPDEDARAGERGIGATRKASHSTEPRWIGPGRLESGRPRPEKRGRRLPTHRSQNGHDRVPRGLKLPPQGPRSRASDHRPVLWQSRRQAEKREEGAGDRSGHVEDWHAGRTPTA